MINGQSLSEELASLEKRTPEDRQQAHESTLANMVSDCVSRIPFYKNFYAGQNVPEIGSIADLEALPIVRKEALIDVQKNNPPFGGLVSEACEKPEYIFASPGPIFEPGFLKEEYWSSAAAFRAAGFNESDVAFNCFSYHLTPGAWLMDSGAKALGASIIPVGNAPKEVQVQMLDQIQPTAYIGTPDYLKSLIELAQMSCKEPLSITKGMVSGGALTPSLRAFFDENGIRVLQCYATAEIGVIAYETESRDGLVINEDVVIEIVDPETGKSQPKGAVGEVVVTKMRKDYPLIRFGTGDLSCLIDGESPCGRTGPRIAGWLGRADMTTKVKGMFVRPTQISALLDSVPSISKMQLVVERENDRDKPNLFCEVAANQNNITEDELTEIIGQKFQETCHVRAQVSLVSSGSLEENCDLILDKR